MRCEYYQELLSPYLDKELTKEEQEALEIHLQSCAYCRASLDRLQEMLKHLKVLQDVELPEGFHEKLMEKIGEQTTTDKTKKRSIPKWIGYISSLAGLFLIGIFWMYTKEGPQERAIAPLQEEIPMQRSRISDVPAATQVGEASLASDQPAQRTLMLQEEWFITTTDIKQVEQVLTDSIENEEQMMTIEQGNTLDIVIQEVSDKKILEEELEALGEVVLSFDKQEVDSTTLHICITEKE